MAYDQFNALADNPNALAQFAPKQKTAAVKPKGPGGLKGFLINSLPAIGGGLGAVAGIPGDLFSAGASSVAGGAVGAAGGEALKQRLLGESLSPKQIGIQAAEGGAAGALGGVARGTKTVAQSLSKLGLKGAEDVPETANAVQKSGMLDKLSNAGTGMRKEARGIKPGATQPGTSQRLSPKASDNLEGYLDSIGGAKNSAHAQLRAVESDLDKNGKNISDLVGKHDRPTTPDEHLVIHNSAEKAASKSLGFNPEDPLINGDNGVIPKLAQHKGLGDLQEIKGTLDDTLQNFFSKNERNASTTATEKVLKGYRDGIKKVLNDAIPGFEETNKQYSLGVKAQNQLLKSANPNGLRFFGVQTGLGGEGVQATKDFIGRNLQKLGGNAPKVARVDKNLPADVVKTPDSIMGSLTGIAKNTATLPIRAPATAIAHPLKSAGAVGVQGLLRGLAGAKAPEQVQADNGTADLAGTLTTPSTDQSQEDPNNPFGQQSIQQAVLQDLQTNGGKNVSTLLSLYNAFGKPDTTKSLNSTQQQQANNATSGLQDLQSISDMIQQDPSLALKDTIPGGSLAHRLTGTTDFDAAKSNVVDVISRLRSGAAISTSEEKLYKSLLPSAGDSAESAQAKISRLQSLLGSFANPQPTSSTDISNLVTQGA